jgi:hypothetical protein
MACHTESSVVSQVCIHPSSLRPTNSCTNRTWHTPLPLQGIWKPPRHSIWHEVPLNPLLHTHFASSLQIPLPAGELWSVPSPHFSSLPALGREDDDHEPLLLRLPGPTYLLPTGLSSRSYLHKEHRPRGDTPIDKTGRAKSDRTHRTPHLCMFLVPSTRPSLKTNIHVRLCLCTRTCMDTRYAWLQKKAPSRCTQTHTCA